MTPSGPPVIVTVAGEVQEAPGAGRPGTDAGTPAAGLIRKGRGAALVAVTCTDRPAAVRLARPACRCPDHPGEWLLPLPGGAARGICPADGRTWQLGTPEVA